MRPILNYFFRGLIVAFPLFATFYVISILVNWMDNTFYNLLFGWVPFDLPGLGIVTTFFVLVLLGYMVTRAFTNRIFDYFDQVMARIPVVKIIYTAFKDLTEAFVGNKKRFNEPVLVRLVDGVERVGFVTSKDLSLLNLENRVAVYCPHSYNFSGNLFLVNPEFVTPLDIEPSDAMKFAVSAGVTHIEPNNQ